MHTKNTSSLMEEELEQSIISLENLVTNIEKEDKLDHLSSYAEEFYEKLSLTTKKISHKNVRFSIIQKEVSGNIKLDKGNPVLENFITENHKLKCP